ncbi:7976_t:CDS:2 [Diversispora eburnea]|uniref:7976_t:CDS:1 n=1 Tax=Diversispora eburnea TaxID=1213867 RepID=A0A9N9G1D3_9GLOM|nr:7976_t:CDS:2 [Diversispora eburnea]
MDEEAKKKHCHFLMFEVGQNAISSGNKLNNNDEMDDERIVPKKEQSPFTYHPYDNSSTFKNIAEPFNHQQGMNDQGAIEPTALVLPKSPSSTSSLFSTSTLSGKSISKASNKNPAPTKTRKPRARKPKRTPRPPNAFILYRKDKQPHVVGKDKNLTNAEVSKVISKMWWLETEEERFRWEKHADRMKLKHMQEHPNYVYQPKKPGIKKSRKSLKGRENTMSRNSTSTFSAIPNTDKNLYLRDEATITAIAESAFAESRSQMNLSSTSFTISTTTTSSKLSSPPHSANGSPTYSSGLMNQNINNNLRIQQNPAHIMYTHLPPTPTEMVHYEIPSQYLLSTNENFINPMLSSTKTYFPATSNFMSPHALNNNNDGIETYLDPQPVDKFHYFIGHETNPTYATLQTFNGGNGGINEHNEHNTLFELFSSSNTVTANSTPDNDNYFDEPCSPQNHFQSVLFSRRNSYSSLCSTVV